MDIRGNAPLEPGRQKRDRLLAWGLAGGVHLIVLGLFLWPRATPAPAKPSPEILMVTVAQNPKPPGPPDQANPGGGTIEPSLLRPATPVAAAVIFRVQDNSDLLSESQIAGAASVGEGGGGSGGCDLARAVQQALRRDPLVHSAVQGANRLGKAVMMWNGDWVRSGGQDGKGLSAVREAIMWQVAFAPQACRNERMRKPVLLSLADGSTRFAIGSGDWRWSDLLGLRKVPAER